MRVVRNAALRNTDCAECYEIGEIKRNATRWREIQIVLRNATRLAKFCGIMIVWNAECNEMGEILLSMDEIGEILRNTD